MFYMNVCGQEDVVQQIAISGSKWLVGDHRKRQKPDWITCLLGTTEDRKELQ